MMKRMGRFLFLLFLFMPMVAQANTVTEGKDGLTWTFSSVMRMTSEGARYDIRWENDYGQGMITRDEEIDVEPFGQLDENGLPWVIWSRQKQDGHYRLHLSTFNGYVWSDPEELPVFEEFVNDRECNFRLGDTGRVYITFLRELLGEHRVMFGIYKTWSGGWTEVGPVTTLEEGYTARQPNVFMIYDDLDVLAEILISFIHVYPEGEGMVPPDGDGLYETIAQYLRVFNSGDTSPWFSVQ